MKNADAKRVWKVICKKLGTRVVYSRSWAAWFKRRTARRFLYKMGIDNIDEFLKTRWIYVPCPKPFILAPEKIGAKGTDPVNQVAKCAHEHQHHWQCVKIGWIAYLSEYALKKQVRAAYEAEAKAAGADVYKALGLGIPSADIVFSDRWADVYRLNNRCVNIAKNKYNRLVRKHEGGAYATQMGACVARLTFIRRLGLVSHRLTSYLATAGLTFMG